MRTKKKSVSIDETVYTELGYYEKYSFLDKVKKIKQDVKKIVIKIVDDFKTKKRVYSFAEKREIVRKRNLTKNSLTKHK